MTAVLPDLELRDPDGLEWYRAANRIRGGEGVFSNIWHKRAA